MRRIALILLLSIKQMAQAGELIGRVVRFRDGDTPIVLEEKGDILLY